MLLKRMATWYICVTSVLLVTCIRVLVQAQDVSDTSVCTTSTPKSTDPARPQLPDKYMMQIECNIVNRNFTANYEEYYDFQGNRAAVHITNNGLKTSEIFRYDTNELFTINEYTKVCQSDVLSTDADRLLFGYKPHGAQGYVFSVNGALRFSSNIPEMWVNQTVVRGKLTNLWRSCQYLPQMNATMLVDWYWTVPYPKWKSATAQMQDQVPVRAHVYGKRWQNNIARSFDHIYEIAFFSPNISDDSIFEIPDDVICPVKTDAKQLPSLSKSFNYAAEIQDINQKTVSYIETVYDSSMNLVRYDYKPQYNTGFGLNNLINVDDFNTGVTYIMDKALGNCTTRPIDGSGFDAELVDTIHIRLKTPKESFGLDKYNYTYQGTRTVRDILCDVWATVRTDWPPGAPTNSTYEWYFATRDYLQTNNNLVRPVMLDLKADTLGMHLIYNFYEYNEGHPSIWDFDISACFNYTQRKDLAFLLPGDFMSIVSPDEVLFKYEVLIAILGYTAVSPLRISNLQVEYADKNNILVSFTLLDKAPLIGKVLGPVHETSLNVAATLLQNTINNNQFIVTDQAQTYSLVAKPVPSF